MKLVLQCLNNVVHAEQAQKPVTRCGQRIDGPTWMRLHPISDEHVTEELAALLGDSKSYHACSECFPS